MEVINGSARSRLVAATVVVDHEIDVIGDNVVDYGNVSNFSRKPIEHYANYYEVLVENATLFPHASAVEDNEECIRLIFISGRKYLSVFTHIYCVVII